MSMTLARTPAVRTMAAIAVLLALVVGAMAPTRAAAVASGGAAAGEHTGTLDNGATWRAVVPDGWNGSLLLYSHGYVPSFAPIPNVARIAPDPATEAALLAAGYGLAGSSYARAGWALDTAAADQLATLDAATAAIGVRPDRVLAVGTSMGGLVTSQLAEIAGDVIDGALPTCGLMAGGVDLNNHQLDGEHAIDTLLARGIDIPLVGFDDAAEGSAAASALVAALEEAQQTAQGRARVALAAALFHAPDWRPGTEEPRRWDHEARQRAQYAWLTETMGFVVPARFDIEATAGGNASWNVGVDYRALLRASDDRHQVAALYRRAGLDLREDLDLLTAEADIAPDRAALAELYRTSSAGDDLAMPVLSLHTTDDNLAPVEYEEEYAEDVRRNGDRRLLRQAYVARPGHCTFTTAELVTGVRVLERRVATGRWGAVTPWALNRAADALELGEAAFVRGRPGEFVGDRRWTGTAPR